MIMILTQKLTKDIIRESSFQTYQETKLNLIQEFNGLKAKLNFFVDVSLDSFLNVQVKKLKLQMNLREHEKISESLKEVKFEVGLEPKNNFGPTANFTSFNDSQIFSLQ